MPKHLLGAGGESGGSSWPEVAFRRCCCGRCGSLGAQPTGACGRGQEFDAMLLITAPAQRVTCDPTCPGWPETRSLRAKDFSCTAELFNTVWVEVLF